MGNERKHCTYNTGRYCGQGCMLRLGFEHQANNGGFATSEKAKEIPCGPYWPKTNWQEYTSQLELASERGCACREELIRLIQKTTSEKDLRGEII